MTTEPVYDIAIIGGGINGCGIARDAAGRGLSVYLCEMNDLASGTSSWSTKLIHGGLRYLEYFEFRLVREALIEREVLWSNAPHVIRPLRLVLPHRKGLRPAWILRLGLFVYDHLGGRRKLPGTTRIALNADEAGGPLAPGAFTAAFEYSDCTVDDARLVALNALDARARGALIETGMRAVRAVRSESGWDLTIENRQSKSVKIVRARTLVNAAGPWVEAVLARAVTSRPRAKVRLVQGSHIVVPKLYEHQRAYILQNPDGRIVFAIPYLDDFTLVGTTDRDYSGDPAEVHATEPEIAYLCKAISANFARQITSKDVVWSFSGLRPLYDDGASEAKAATRDYTFEIDAVDGHTPLLSVFGGKITTYRKLAERAIEQLVPFLPAASATAAKTKAGWTARAALPGGDFPAGKHEEIQAQLAARYPFLSPMHLRRLVGAYGTRASTILESARSMADLGQCFGADLTEAEVRYLMSEEWARTADDVLWRRTKLGIRMSKSEAATLNAWMAEISRDRGPGPSASPA